MNLGNANLKAVNASKPQLAHTPSKQSIAASDDYYSFSDHASDVSAASDTSAVSDRTTIRRYETPPLQMRSPRRSQDTVHAPQTQSATRTIPQPLPEQGSRSTRFDNESLVTKPLPVAQHTTWRPSASEVSPPTPGVDDSPYIHFAIDQLTRDEELMGRRRQRGGSEDSYASQQIDLPVDLRLNQRVEQPVPTSDVPLRGPAGDPRRGIPVEEAIHALSPTAQDEEDEVQRNQSLEERYPLHPLVEQNTLESEVLVLPRILSVASPVLQTHTRKNTFQYSKLNYIPTPLRLPSILGLVFCCTLMLAGLIFCSAWSSTHNGLWLYNGVGTNRYFVFEFLPQILASVIIVWLLVIQAAAQRVLPFSLLASQRSRRRARFAHNAPLFATNFLIPNLSFYNHNDPSLSVAFFVFWLCLFTIPLQSSLFQTRLYSGVWIWATVQPISWILIALYFLLILALLTLYFRFARRTTGLKWDPTSLADIITMLQRHNALSEFDIPDYRRLLQNSRLGYWANPERPGEALYGIGEDNKSTPLPFADKDEARPGIPERRSTDLAIVDLESQQSGSSSSTRYLWIPWFLRDTWAVAWIVIAFILTIAFLVVSFVNKAVIDGFFPLLPAPTTSLSFSPANFLYSFLPSLLGMFLFLFWQPIDMYFRALQPFANLTNPHGATAEKSLLLDYTACLPIEVTVKATLAGHYKVAWISFISILSLTLPILGGGIFTAQFFTSTQDVREAASPSAYYALCVFVVIYALSFVAIWPTRKRYLPHDISTLADIVDFIYIGGLRGDAIYREPLSKVDLVTRLMAVPRGGEQGGAKFTFRRVGGRSESRMRWAIERVQRFTTRTI